MICDVDMSQARDELLRCDGMASVGIRPASYVPILRETTMASKMMGHGIAYFRIGGYKKPLCQHGRATTQNEPLCWGYCHLNFNQGSVLILGWHDGLNWSVVSGTIRLVRIKLSQDENISES